MTKRDQLSEDGQLNQDKGELSLKSYLRFPRSSAMVHVLRFLFSLSIDEQR